MNLNLNLFKFPNINPLKVSPALLLLAALFFSCSDRDLDDFEENNENKAELVSVPSYYMPIAIEGNSADIYDLDGDFESGAEIESVIDPLGHHFAIFFDNKGEFHSLTLFNPGERTEFEEGNIEAQHTTIITVGTSPRELDKNDPNREYIPPKYCFVVLNGSPLESQIRQFAKNTGSNSIAHLLRMKWSSTSSGPIGQYKRNGNSYFTMTNSSYFLQESSGKYSVNVAAEINDGMLFKTVNMAKAAAAERPNETILRVFVERLVAKFTVKFTWTNESENHLMTPPSNNPEAPFGSNQYITVAYFNDQGALTYASRVWDTTVLGWDITNLETENYLFKALLPPDNIHSYPESVSSLTSPFDKFNDAANWRCNWSYDCHYDYDVDYDNQYRYAVDRPSLKYFQNVESQHPLHYLAGREIRESVEDNDPIYAPENTFANASNFNIAGTFLIVKGRLNIDLHYFNENDGVPEDIFRSRKGVYYTSENDYKRAFIIEINNKLISNTSYNYKYYDWENWVENHEGGASRTLNLKQGEDYRLFKELVDGRLIPIEDPDDLTLEDAFVIDGDCKKMVWAQDHHVKLVIARTYYNAEGDELYEKVETVTDNVTGKEIPITDNDIRSWFYDWIGAADHFAQGQMYYAKAIPHLRNLVPADQVDRGDYGVVRNNWYNISITAISKVGTPISNLSQPIVPTVISLEDGLVYDVDLLGWHIFESEVTFPSIAF
ncbi:MAG: fimbria major subunit [Muribaculaceae bacterium]|nr:fimbria major subunit [Muribaculaceae bacterium]